jgi:hypothetical protein
LAANHASRRPRRPPSASSPRETRPGTSLPGTESGGPSHASRRRCQLPALLGAAAAGLCATLAMLCLVLRALVRAAVACVGADPANLRREPGAPAHEARADPAEIGAVDAKTRAVRHVPETGVGAVLALLCAPQTRFDAGPVLLMRHRIPPFESNGPASHGHRPGGGPGRKSAMVSLYLEHDEQSAFRGAPSGDERGSSDC